MGIKRDSEMIKWAFFSLFYAFIESFIPFNTLSSILYKTLLNAEIQRAEIRQSHILKELTIW